MDDDPSLTESLIAASNTAKEPQENIKQNKSLTLDTYDKYNIKPCVIWSVLILALIACAFFLVGQLTPMWGLGASINVQFNESSNQSSLVKSYEPYQMSLFFSIKCCIETGLVPEVILGVILFFFSGVWPHVKLGLMLYCWFGRMNHRLRHIILYWVDSFGKYSFADPLVVVALMVAFTVGVELTEGDMLFDQLANLVLKDEGLDGSLATADVESIHIKLDIVAFYGIYFFCFGVWLSLILGSVVEHYNMMFLIILTEDDVLSSENSGLLESITEDNEESPPISQASEYAKKWRDKTKWVTALLTIPILPFLITSYVVPLFERYINGVLPMLITLFGWIPSMNGEIIQPIAYSEILTFLIDANAWIMVLTVIIFVLAAPTLRSMMLDLMWYMPSSFSLVSNGMSRKEARNRQNKVLSASNISSILDSLAVWLFAVILVHFEISAIAAQIAMPFCNEVAVGAQGLEAICPELQTIGGFWDNPKYSGALDIFTRKHPDFTLPDSLEENCGNIVNIAESFNLDQCFDIQIGFMLGMWLVTVAVVLAYFSSLMLTYPWSVDVLGRDYFEAPVCYRPQGWLCCCCCVGESKNGRLDKANDEIVRYKVSCKESMRGCCWCCARKKKLFDATR